MVLDHALDQLWDTAEAATEVFQPESIAALPDTARRYLRHAIAPGARLATAARIRMHGTIRLKGEWLPFSAEQVLRWDRGFVWRARTRVNGLPVSGFDRLVDGEAMLRWKALGIFPVVSASGPEIARSAAGRLHAEAMWLPAVLLGADVRWTEAAAERAELTIRAHGEESHIALDVDDRGAVRTFSMARWGDLDSGTFRYEDFGGYVDAERTFDGITVPTELRLGWYFGSSRFEAEGEFFRATVDDLEHR